MGVPVRTAPGPAASSGRGGAEVLAFLTHLAVDRNLAASTQAQALAALQSLYRHVIDRPLVGLGRVPKAHAPVRLPVVLSAGEDVLNRGGLGVRSPIDELLERARLPE